MCQSQEVSHRALNGLDVAPKLKIGSKSKIGNYRPISILPNISKIFERPLFQMSSFFNQIFSKFQCWLSKRL